MPLFCNQSSLQRVKISGTSFVGEEGVCCIYMVKRVLSRCLQGGLIGCKLNTERIIVSDYLLCWSLLRLRLSRNSTDRTATDFLMMRVAFRFVSKTKYYNVPSTYFHLQMTIRCSSRCGDRELGGRCDALIVFNLAIHPSYDTIIKH